MSGDWLVEIANRLPELWLRTGEHLVLTGVSTAAAIVVGVPLGIVAEQVRRLRGPLLGGIGVLQTIPSLAMLALLLLMVGKIGAFPAIVALTLYALLPIVRNTLTGLENTPPEVLEAARGVGMTKNQQLWLVKIPLAMPVILAGIRTAAVVGVGIATLSAFIGAGGLGQFINRGLAFLHSPLGPQLILLGAVPAAILALLVDFSIGAAAWAFQPTRRHERGGFKAKLKPVAALLPVLLIAIGTLGHFTRASLSSSGLLAGATPTGSIRIATKNFTEQLILGELMAQLIERKTDLSVDRRFNLAGTMICHGALVNGEVDLYAEYTGTALTTVLEHDVLSDPDEVLRVVRSAYQDLYDLEWFAPFGFNNTYAIAVRESDAGRHGWTCISDLHASASQLRAGFTAEFSERPDGYPGLQKAYEYGFGEVTDLDPAIMYDAIARREVDVICAFATDGRIAAFDLKPLRDDRNFFPPYNAAPVVRREVLRVHPELRSVLGMLAGVLDDATMRRLNYDVDQNGKRPEAVAREFLIAAGLLQET